jgi:hypothetical protein
MITNSMEAQTMEKYLSDAFKQLDEQADERKIQLAFINLNNLYLSVERGTTKMNIHVQNDLYRFAGIVYPFKSEPIMSEY